MRDRAKLPIPARVRYRLMFALPLSTCCLLMGGTIARAQETNPAAPTPTTPAATPAAQPPDSGADVPDVPLPPGATYVPPADVPPPAQAPTTLTVTVRSTETGAPPVSFANVRLESETERPRSGVSNVEGIRFFDRLTDGVYTIYVTGLQRRPAQPIRFTVLPHVANALTVFLSPQGATNILVNGNVDLLDTGDYSISYTRDRRFMRDFPFDAANHQNLNSFYLSVPGVAYDGGNNYFARGDGAVAGSTYLDDLMAPANAQGRGNPLYLPQALSSFKAIVGNFAPEYSGNGMVTVLNTTPIPTEAPTLDAELRAGGYNTAEDYLTFGTRAYSDFGNRGAGATATGKRTFAGAPMGYIFSVSQRITNNALEAPQSSPQTVSNYGESEMAMAKFSFRLKSQSEINALINYSTGHTDIADRTGLPSSYGQVGQGYGFAGAFPMLSGLGNQQDEGKSDLQKDNNLLTVVGIDHDFTSGAHLRVAAGSSRSTYNITSATPLSGFYLGLPGNASTEFRPNVNNDYQTSLLQADLTAPTKNNHNFKFGLLYQDIVGNESYQLVPGSQIALDALHALDPRLVPEGGLTGGRDALGFPTYTVASQTNNTPVLAAHRTGSYAAAYAQDTWKFRPRLTFNYGLRVDDYTAKTGTARIDTVSGFVNQPGQVARLTSTQLEPRFNGVLEFPEPSNRARFLRFLNFLTNAPTLARFGYNRLFSAPGLNQGNIIGEQPAEGQGGTQTGQPAQAQTTDQYDVQIERQLNTRGKLSIGFYNKSISHYLQSEQLIPGLQSDTLSIFNQGDVVSNGENITLELFPGRINDPVDRAGFHGFLTFEESQTHPKDAQQFNNLNSSNGANLTPYVGRFAPYVDGDQTNMVSFGLSLRQKSGSSIGLSGYFGSGLYESSAKFYTLPVRLPSTRQGFQEVNLRYSTGPRFLKNTSAIQVEVANLFNTKERIDYEGAYGGTRFQQGTRVFLNFAAHL